MSLLLFVLFVLLLGQVSNKPRSELEEILQRIAPDKEVMIGISNYNLIPAGELVSFLDVRRALLPDSLLCHACMLLTSTSTAFPAIASADMS